MNLRITILFWLMAFSTMIFAQSGSIHGKVTNGKGEVLEFANAGLFMSVDSSLVKLELSNESGDFSYTNLPEGVYFIKISSLGFADYRSEIIKLNSGENIQLPDIKLEAIAISLKETTVTARRSMIEVKPDKTVFNIEGTINSIGSDAISLLRKAPGITVDNNDNINVLGRNGVLLYVDGKRLPLGGQDLSNYLQSLNADQIDRFEIISNPGARYEAQGNAGIIDIRLKKDKKLGANGNINTTYSQGDYSRYNVSGSGNFRNKYVNVYGNAGSGVTNSYNLMEFESVQNGLFLKEINNGKSARDQFNFKAGIDLFLTKNQTLGFLASGDFNNRKDVGVNSIELAGLATSANIDSILIANTEGRQPRQNQAYNVNYQYNINSHQNLNIDLDYGNYTSKSQRDQINRYFKPDGNTLLSEIFTFFDTPSDINISSVKADYNQNLLGGSFSIGTKLTKVVSDNTFLFYDVLSSVKNLNQRNSNKFNYDEKVYAGYIQYSGKLSSQINFSAGLRAEQTHTSGELTAFLPELQEPPVQRSYLNWFPSGGVTWTMSPTNSVALNYGRRINRPDYNVLNPFYNQLSQLSFEKGNPLLKPEIVNNLELNYTLNHMYNFKIGYSKTIDQITRLIGPDDSDPRASYINWDNLANQTVWSISASLPFQINSFWNAYFNINGSHISNKADYGNGAIVDLQAYSYSIFQQQTFTLPKGITAEISGYYSGPGIWGGVFKYESNWSLDVGLQKRFLQDQLTVKISGSDLFFQSWWSGTSNFDGLSSYGSGKNDSRRVTLSVGYTLGNKNVKSRKRETGLEEEAQRVK